MWIATKNNEKNEKNFVRNLFVEWFLFMLIVVIEIMTFITTKKKKKKIINQKHIQ